MTPVYLEIGKKRVFACALEWPGWCRSGAGEDAALAALAASGSRYTAVAAEAGLAFDIELTAEFAIVERLPGSATTDFGAPDKAASRDFEPLAPGEAERIGGLVAASWTVFDRAAARAPALLMKGPRGGGRDRDAVVKHVLAAETAYARKIGVRRSQPPAGDNAAVAGLHKAILEALREERQPGSLEGKAWPLRYVARRMAWHALDHAWEIEDKGGRL